MPDTTHVALLRAINVAGHAVVAMADLRALLEKLGLADVRSLLQSGNLVFRSDGRGTAQLEELLAKEAARRLGLRTDFFVRTSDEWREMVAGNPFPKQARSDPARLVAVLLKAPVGSPQVKALQAAIAGREVVRGKGRQVYVVYPDGQGRSRLTNAVIERKLGTSGTARNWNTVLKLAALAEEG